MLHVPQKWHFRVKNTALIRVSGVLFEESTVKNLWTVVIEVFKKMNWKKKLKLSLTQNEFFSPRNKQGSDKNL